MSNAATTYYHTDLGKLQVTPATGGDKFHFWSGSCQNVGGHGTIAFVLKSGLAHDLRSASDLLTPHIGVRPRMAESSPAGHPAPVAFRPPARVLDRAASWSAVRDYLCGVRRLPENVVRPLVQARHPTVYAGWGERDGRYLVFPIRSYASPSQPMVGAIVRWRSPDAPPDGASKAPKRGQGAGERGWWQVGPYPAPTLIVCEAPVDALSLWSALNPEDRTTTRILATGGTGFPSAPGLFAGVERIITAQDRDQEGRAQTEATLAQARTAGLAVPTIRLEPPKPTKDWSDVWMAAPDLARRLVAQTLHPNRERAAAMSR